MKHWYRSFTAKAVCFILFILSVIVLTACIVGAVYISELGVYTNSKSNLIHKSEYDFINSSVNNIYEEAVFEHDGIVVDEYSEFHDSNTNLRFRIIASDGNVVLQNINATADRWEYERYFKIIDEYEYEFLTYEMAKNDDDCYLMQAYIDREYPAVDRYSILYNVISFAYLMRYSVYVIALASLMLAISCFVILMCTSARRPNSNDIHPGPLNRVPYDVLIAVMIAIAFLIAYLTVDVFYSNFESAVFLVIVLPLYLSLLLGMFISLAARVKQRSLIKTTLIYEIISTVYKLIKKLITFMNYIFSNVSLVWKTAAISLGMSILEIGVIAGLWYDVEKIIWFFLLEKLIVVSFIVYCAVSLKKLQRSGEALAGGNLTYKTDVSALIGDFKKHGENLNSIAHGMSAAVEKRLQSERMKTELITNVSHDIKTPLTSIINYSNLISQNSCNCAEHKEYSDVLVRRSEHLKRLLEDLVEASKASSGVLDISLNQCDAGVLLTQVVGEYEERCRQGGLDLIVTKPEEDISVMFDSRRIWRVFENLMNNVCKYSLSGTRVYLSLERVEDTAVFTIRNVSAYPLNISAAELSERFVRGDASRSTEGNGLGLSIARSLTELQNGQMDIVIDGDLFKVILEFPIKE